MTGLSMYVIYDSPLDAPGKIVVRRWLISGGKQIPCETTEYDRLSLARAIMIARGLSRLERDPGDDPVIVETWL